MSANRSSSGGGSGSGVGSGGSSSGSSGGGGGPCGACKFLRRKCVAGCIFAPYFDSEQGAANFAAVHKVFGASNVSKLLLHIPVNKRVEAVVSICYEAQARLRDPVNGCVAHILALQQQVVSLQAELSYLRAYLATLELPTPPLHPPPQPLLPPPPVSVLDLPTASFAPPVYDLSSPFDPMVQHSWTMHQQQMDPHQFGRGSTISSSEMSLSAPNHGGSRRDLLELAHELLHGQGSPPV